MSSLGIKLSEANFSANKMIVTSKGDLKKANWGQRAVIWLSDKTGSVSHFYNRATAEKLAELVGQSTLDVANPQSKVQAKANLAKLQAEFIKHSSSVSHAAINDAFKRAIESLNETSAIRRDARNITSMIGVEEPDSEAPPVTAYFSQLEDHYLLGANLHPDVERARQQLGQKYAYRPLSGQDLKEAHIALSRLGLKQLIAEYGKDEVFEVLGKATCFAIARGKKLLNLNLMPHSAEGSAFFHLSSRQHAAERQAEVREAGFRESSEALFEAMAGKYSPEAVEAARGELPFKQAMNQERVDPKSFDAACRAELSRITSERAHGRSQALGFLHDQAFSDEGRVLLSGATSVESVKEQIIAGVAMANEAGCVSWIRDIFTPEASNRIIGEALRLMEIEVGAKDLPEIDGKAMSDLLQAEAEDFDDGHYELDYKAAFLKVIQGVLYPPAPQEAVS